MNKGFTLVETITVIIILSGIMLIAVPAYNGVSSTIRKTNYKSKTQAIESATLKYANLHLMDDIKPSTCESNCFKCYDLYDFVLANGIYASEETKEDGSLYVINPLIGSKLKGCVNIVFNIEKGTLSAEFTSQNIVDDIVETK